MREQYVSSGEGAGVLESVDLAVILKLLLAYNI